MSRRKLTSNKRSFRKNNKVFLDENAIQPADMTINDGVNPEYTIRVDVRTRSYSAVGSLPGGVVVTGPPGFTQKPDVEEL